MIKEIVLDMPMGRYRLPKKVGFKFTLFTTWLVCDLNDIGLDELGSLDPEKALADTIYCAAKWYYYDKGKKPKWLKRDIGSYWMKHMSVEQSGQLAKVMNDVAYEVKEMGEQSKKK